MYVENEVPTFQYLISWYKCLSFVVVRTGQPPFSKNCLQHTLCSKIREKGALILPQTEQSEDIYLFKLLH